jgi:hypothetical protein
MTLVPAVTYQGAKARIAPAICARLDRSGCPLFYDLCCGTGSVAIEMVNQGFYAPHQIVMVDSGPWGLFWKTIGEGVFVLERFRRHLDAIPKDRSQIREHLIELAKQPVNSDAVYIFLILQAGAFGGKAVFFDESDQFRRWANCTFRDYWQPTATSNRRSPVNPMMPMPDTLFERVGKLVNGMAAVKGLHQYAEFVRPPGNALVYIDPPYEGTTGYGDTIDIPAYIGRLRARCYVSEGRALSPNAVCISTGRCKGGISGERKKANEEWLSPFNTLVRA